MIQNHEFQSSIGEEILGLWGRHVVEVLAVAPPRAHAHMLRGIDEVLSVNVSLEHPSDFDFQGMGGGHLFACEVSLDE